MRIFRREIISIRNGLFKSLLKTRIPHPYLFYFMFYLKDHFFSSITSLMPMLWTKSSCYEFVCCKIVGENPGPAHLVIKCDALYHGLETTRGRNDTLIGLKEQFSREPITLMMIEAISIVCAIQKGQPICIFT